MVARRWSAVAALLLACACDRDGSTGAPSASSSSMLPPLPSPAELASSSPSASASPSPSLVAPPAPTRSPLPAPAPSASASLAADGGATCGKKPLPDCPLQAWMKQNMTPPLQAKDYEGIAESLTRAAAFAPAGYTNWASIAKDGANAAREADLNAVKAACRGCHEQYKAKYRSEMRARPVP